MLCKSDGVPREEIKGASQVTRRPVLLLSMDTTQSGSFWLVPSATARVGVIF